MPDELSLNCIVVGDTPDHIFPVKIASTECIGALKDAIKEKRTKFFEQVDATSLRISKVSLPIDENFRSDIEAFCSGKELQHPTTRISKVFSDLLDEEVHVLVRAPGACEDQLSPLYSDLTQTREKVLKLRTLRSPSQQAQPGTFDSIQKDKNMFYHCTRPVEREPQIPSALLHPFFGQFVDDCKGINLSPDDYDFVRDLREAMCRFYGDEEQRRGRLCEPMRSYGIDVHAAKVGGSKCNTDGHVLVGKHPTFIQEIKNEVGSSGAEPFLQALSYYDQFVRENRLWEDATSCHPCIVAFFAGPHVGFGCCALTDRSTLDVFSLLSLSFHSTDEDSWDVTARHFRALKKAVNALGSDYTEKEKDLVSQFNSLSVNSDKSEVVKRQSFVDCPASVSRGSPIMPATFRPGVAGLFPYPTMFRPRMSTAGEPSSFTYGTSIEQRHLFFKGHIKDGRPICIKFVRRYGESVHAFCADAGFAPKLLAFDKLPGGWFMVVMELLDESWVPLTLVEQHSSHSGVRQKIRSDICKLHEQNMVHGDLRDANIMVKAKKKGSLFFADQPVSTMLVDFDWAGVNNEVLYPQFISKVIQRPENVISGLGILADHDISMFDYIFRR